MPDIPASALAAAEAAIILAASDFSGDTEERSSRKLARAALEAAAPLLAEVVAQRFLEHIGSGEAWGHLGDRTWEQLRECTWLALVALDWMANGSSPDDARRALAGMGRVLSDEWDGKHPIPREGTPDAP